MSIPSNILYFDLCGRTTIVTCAARGIGLQVPRHLNQSGAGVCLVDFDADEVERPSKGMGTRGIAADVSSTAGVATAIGEVVAGTGRLNIILNNAEVLRDTFLWKRATWTG